MVTYYYTENYINGYDVKKNFDELLESKNKYIPNYYKHLKEFKSLEGNLSCITELETKVKRSDALVSTLLGYLNMQLQESDSDEAVPRKADEMDKLQRVINGFDVDASQRFAFAGQPLGEVGIARLV